VKPEAAERETANRRSIGTNGQSIATAGTFDGLTYNFTAGPELGTLTGGIITSEFNSFSGLSAAGNQSTGQHFFFGGDQVTVIFPTPVTAVGVFFNVNPIRGTTTSLPPWERWSPTALSMTRMTPSDLPARSPA
jgi:hypothetical protein